jgi:hypothetical protein
VRQFGPIPRGEATPQQIRAFASQSHDVDGHLRGKTRPWPRGQERRRGRAWPRGGPRSVARPPPAQRRMGRSRLPTGGESPPGEPARSR